MRDLISPKGLFSQLTWKKGQRAESRVETGHFC